MRQYLQNASEALYLDWEDVLPALLICYNMSISNATRKSPFSLVFGMEARMPIFDLEERVNYSENQEDIITLLRKMREEAKSANQYKAEDNKHFGIMKRELMEGNLILVKNNHKVGANPKLQSSLLGREGP